MSRTITVWPARVRAEYVSTTVRPVTHTALVAVNSASIYLMLPLEDARGRASNRLPTKMIPAK
jgi:hypothetical protein